MVDTAPKFAQNAALKLLAHTYGWRRCRAVVKREYLAEDQLREIQAEKLRRLVRHAYQNVPLYRNRLQDAGLAPQDIHGPEDLPLLPPLTKQDVAANFPDRIIAGGTRGFSWKHLTSTGTTSDRIDIMLNVSASQWRHALELRTDFLSGCPIGTRRLELPPDICSRECGVGQTGPDGFWGQVRYAAAQSGKPLYEFASALNRLMRQSVRKRLFKDKTMPPFGPEGTNISDERLREYVDAILEFHPYMLVALPVYLQEIARYMKRKGMQAPVKLIRPIGSVSTQKLKREWADIFEGEVYETYGSNELGPIACECEERNGLHVAMENYVVEVVRDGQPAQPGELGEVLVTCLDNYAMPMLRYRIADVGRRYNHSCPCGRSSQLIEVNGRLQDLIVTEEGQVIPEDQLMDFFYYEIGLRQFQLVERRAGEFDLLIVPEDGSQVDTEQVVERTRQLLGETVQIQPFVVETIYPEATGKFRFVKSASYEHFAALER